VERIPQCLPLPPPSSSPRPGGSGWVLLSWSPRDRKLVKQWASDYCHTLAGSTPIPALDMPMDFGAKTGTYVDTFMEVIRWNNAERLFVQTTGRHPVTRLEEMTMRAVHLLAICAVATIGTAASAQDIDWKKVDEALGRSAAVTGDVHRYGFPRSDLTVTLDGVTIKPALALGGWTAFKPMHGGAMVMGDLLLLE